MNRLHQLALTLPINLQDEYPNLEVVLVNYSSSDDLDTWIKPYLNKITYVKVENKSYFHMAHAKNIAAKHASGDILVNVDADNFTGKGFGRYINNLFASSQNIVAVGFDGKHTTGRIAMLKEHLYALTGYDEHMTGWGFEDIDMCNRAVAGLSANIHYIKQNEFLQTVPHRETDRVLFHQEKNYQLSNIKNRTLSINNLKNKITSPNETWGEF